MAEEAKISFLFRLKVTQVEIRLLCMIGRIFGPRESEENLIESQVPRPSQMPLVS